ncbi:hypothetical protein IGI37_003234 [Enterococcus sp. AZ194]|uniref:hypothetical protein n=1 Tax=Enterococcus sp. AZ194 TaxID=2774629 RepID=UPI003F27BCE5
MLVITEEILRKKFLKKELFEGSEFIVDVDSFLTPAAKSYLREHQIHIKTGEKKTIFSNAREKEPYVSKGKTEAVTEAKYGRDDANKQCRQSSQVSQLLNVLTLASFEIRQLANLFYFPLLEDTSFTWEWWFYFEYQQKWLKKFCLFQEDFEAKEVICPNTELTLNRVNQRLWKYSRDEIDNQIDKIQCLLEEVPVASAIFKKWSHQLREAIHLAENK